MADVAAVVAKWQRNMTGAGPTIKAGVMAVRESPMEKAANSAQLYAQKVQEAVASGRYQAGLRAVSLSEWQEATANKGVNRITAGVQAALPKVQAFQAQLQPFAEQVKRQIATMPKGGPAESDARMLAAVNMMRSFRFQRRAA
jgi:hypothetical protein